MKQTKRGFERLPVGDRKLIRRVLQRCRDARLKFEIERKKIKVASKKSSTKITGYIVPISILSEERDRRELELESLRNRKADELAKRKLAIPIRQDVGFSVPGEETGLSKRGKQTLAAYSSDQIDSCACDLTVEQLKSHWLKKYGSEELVLAHAIRIANRLQKFNQVPEFYDLKNRWIANNQSHLTKCRGTRFKAKPCRSCDGTGRYSLLTQCNRCGGTGDSSPKPLYEYEYEFLIQGIRFRMHSPVAPAIELPENVEEDATKNEIEIGRPWSQDDVPLPPQTLIVELIIELLPPIV